jgi:hypothetical protein
MFHWVKFPGTRNPKKEVVFNLQEISYGQLIKEMDKHTAGDTLFKIYHPDTGITLSANEVILTE